MQRRTCLFEKVYVLYTHWISLRFTLLDKASSLHKFVLLCPRVMGLHVLLYVPNVIGYVRLLLLLAATWFIYDPLLFIPCYVTSVILDGVDGYAARKLKQVSEFGAWFDVVIDILGRGILWSSLFRWGYFISALEWCVFVCTHNSMGADWKNKFGSSPWWVQRVMANGFKTPTGFFAIAGLHVLPIWLYGYMYGVLKDALCMPYHFQWLGILLLCTGRILCMTVEVWCLWNHVWFLIEKDNNVKE